LVKYRDDDLYYPVGYEVLTAVVMKVTVFRDIAPCSTYTNQRFGVTYHLHLQGLSVCASGPSNGPNGMVSILIRADESSARFQKVEFL
jgi:hypothetical protein